MATAESLVDLLHDMPEDKEDDVDSLPSMSTDEIYSEADSSDAQEEWERSLEQLQLILTMMIVPWMGKFFGRKFAYWSWTRYMSWVHNVDVRWTDKKAFNVAGAVGAAATL